MRVCCACARPDGNPTPNQRGVYPQSVLCGGSCEHERSSRTLYFWWSSIWFDTKASMSSGGSWPVDRARDFDGSIHTVRRISSPRSRIEQV
jgi:hypothetical protein